MSGNGTARVGLVAGGCARTMSAAASDKAVTCHTPGKPEARIRRYQIQTAVHAADWRRGDRSRAPSTCSRRCSVQTQEVRRSERLVVCGEVSDAIEPFSGGGCHSFHLSPGRWYSETARHHLCGSVRFCAMHTAIATITQKRYGTN